MQFLKDQSDFKDIDLNNYSESFVPYLYLDGHRSSNAGITDSEKYNSGFNFFMRFGQIMRKLGFKQMVTMVHTSRNCYVKGRLDSIIAAIQKNFDHSNEYINTSTFKFYGDIELYKKIGYKDFYRFLTGISNKKKNNSSFKHHILINYSEEWALNNLNMLKQMPDISSVIRFTKGYVSGGWIPNKMRETTFIYSQIPSVSEYWTDEALTTLLYISLKNWSLMNQYIGKKEYKNDEKDLIHKERDLNLGLFKKKLKVNNIMHNRIIAFGIFGPILYEF
ncbi:MAG: hypothetical protein P8Z35_23345 [Ignavibacteriaceae bacterium]|jgi:hypothetical protein